VVIPRGELPIVHLRIHQKQTDHTIGITNRLRCDKKRLGQCKHRHRTSDSQGQGEGRFQCEARMPSQKTGSAAEILPECHQGGRLAGGVYGVAIGGAFFGESMFHHVTDASKVALAALVDRLRARGHRLLDVQWVTPHLERFGAIEIPRRRYLKLLEDALTLDVEFS
jgi:leucyl/phenylalanyl-tRNA--protein transferase